jgi:hypothetical protein
VLFLIWNKKSLNISKGYSEIVDQEKYHRRKDNIIA